MASFAAAPQRNSEHQASSCFHISDGVSIFGVFLTKPKNGQDRFLDVDVKKAAVDFKKT